jgi:hypothetical protein
MEKIGKDNDEARKNPQTIGVGNETPKNGVSHNLDGESGATTPFSSSSLSHYYNTSGDAAETDLPRVSFLPTVTTGAS